MVLFFLTVAYLSGMHYEKEEPHIQRISGRRDPSLHWTLSKRGTDEETVLLTSETAEIGNYEEIYNVHGIMPSDQTLALTDRLVLRIYAEKFWKVACE